MLFNSKPDYTKFKVFYCTCYPLIRHYSQHKLDQGTWCEELAKVKQVVHELFGDKLCKMGINNI